MTDNTIWTIQRMISWTVPFFEKHHVDSPRLDAELLLSHVLGKERIYLYTDYETILNADELARFKELIQKRIKGICTAALIGKREFMGLTFFVNEHVLIPRPDTETWVEKVIQCYRGAVNMKVADLGTGSGAILLSFLHYCETAEGVGVDISPEALAVAHKNGQDLEANTRAEWRQGDYINALGEDEVFDGIFSNPPYIPTAEINSLSEEVRQEPKIALDGGTDGLHFYRVLAEKAGTHLKEKGFLALEVGEKQAGIVRGMLEQTGQFDSFEVIVDLGGIERAVFCRKK